MKINATVSAGVDISEFTIGESGRYIDIDVNDDNGEMLASVYIEVRDGRAVLVVSPAVNVRDSDEPTMVVDLLTGNLDQVQQVGEQDSLMFGQYQSDTGEGIFNLDKDLSSYNQEDKHEWLL